MAQLDLSAASNVLKNLYLGPIREQLNNSSILLSRIDKDESTQDVSGKNFTVPIHYGRNSTAGDGRADGAALATAGVQAYQTAVVPNKYTYSSIKVTGPTIAAMKNNEGAFIRAVDSEIKGAVRDHKRSMNRQLHGDGKDAIAYWTTADDTSGTNVDDGQGNSDNHLISGATYDLIDEGDNTTKRGDSIVVTVGAEAADGTTQAVTWTGTVTSSADGDYLVREDTLGYQMMGIRGIISASDPVVPAGGGSLTGLHGLAVASHPYWSAQVFSNSGTKRDLTLALLQKPLSAIAKKSDYSDRDVKFILCNFPERDEYVKLCVADKRMVNKMDLDMGFEGVEFNGIPIVPDPQSRRNVFYYVVPESLKLFRSADFDWMDKDGSVLKHVTGYDLYEAVLFHYGDLATIARNANGLLADINS